MFSCNPKLFLVMNLKSLLLSGLIGMLKNMDVFVENFVGYDSCS